jgi:hypothetical protein
LILDEFLPEGQANLESSFLLPSGFRGQWALLADDGQSGSNSFLDQYRETRYELPLHSWREADLSVVLAGETGLHRS